MPAVIRACGVWCPLWRLWVGEIDSSQSQAQVSLVFDYLMDGCTLLEFLDNFPTVTQEAALKLLSYAARRVSPPSLLKEEGVKLRLLF